MPTNSKGNKKGRRLDLKQKDGLDELTALLTLIETPHESNDTELKNAGGIKAKQWPAGCSACSQLQSVETGKLEKFSLRYQEQRDFTFQPLQKTFSRLFTSLVKYRLSNLTWADQAPPHTILRVFVCLRIMMRDINFQQQFCDLSGIKVLSHYLQKATDSYLVYGDGPYLLDILKEMTNVFQKLSAIVQQRESLVKCGVHQSLVLLLRANDVIVLHCTLHALISLAQSPEPRSLIAELDDSIEVLLRILQDYDMLSKKLAANLLRLLCGDENTREMIKLFDGIPLMLSLLHSDSVTLLWNVVWCLVQMSADPEISTEIKLMGGLPLLLSLLHDRKFVSDRTAANTSCGATSAAVKSPALLNEEEIWSNYFFTNMDPNKPSGGKQTEELKEHQLSLKSACCTALTELTVNDTNAQQIVQDNGIYSIGLLTMPPDSTVSEKCRKAYDTLQANAFRALRFLFSKERNRRLFKRVFPPDMFEMFIDIGHYNRDISAYKPLVKKINSLGEDNLDEIFDGIQSTNQNKTPKSFIGDYAVLELLGSGGFGSVYKVKKKKSGQSFLAMKEINALMPEMGKNAKERNKSIGDLISELNIIREQLRHPNVVRYYKTFEEKSKLYIVMELIEGAPLTEHFNSLKEKRERFSEDRVWTIFIQIVLALRYLHKEKGIVHRDLTPNNIMLGEGDKVTLTDFGLAKQKQRDCSKMNSVVGTILYSCPEIVQHQPYGEKADIWALGCVLYQMCVLQPPFYSNNMLSLVKNIVDAEYPPLSEGQYSEKVTSTIRRCLTVEPSERPDVVQVAAHIADIMLIHMDNVRRDNGKLDRKLEQERRRTQKHFTKVNQDMQNYHRMYIVSQERYDKLANLQSSGGAQSIKDEGEAAEQNLISNQKTRNVSSTSHISTEVESESNAEVWGSDDDFTCSSGSESRESSIGHDSRGRLVVPRPPGGTPKNRRSKPPTTQSTTSPPDPYAQLSLEIAAVAKTSRDSGIGSTDPSPGTASNCTSSSATSSPSTTDDDKIRPRAKSFTLVQRSSSMDNTTHKSSPKRQRSTVAKTNRDSDISSTDLSPNTASNSTSSPATSSPSTTDDDKMRPRPKSFSLVHRSSSMDNIMRTSSPKRQRLNSAGKATLTISKRKVNQLSDPILQMLHMVHKIIYICQLPPILCPNSRRRMIERYKRALFSPQSNTMNLKDEISKLLRGSQDLIDINFGPNASSGLVQQVRGEQDAARAQGHSANVLDTDVEEAGVTYEQMTAIIETVLVESGYYDMSQSVSHSRTLSSITASGVSSSRVRAEQIKNGCL